MEGWAKEAISADGERGSQEKGAEASVAVGPRLIAGCTLALQDQGQARQAVSGLF